MKKIQKLCGVKRSIFNLHKEDILTSIKKIQYICKKCLKICKDKQLLCYPESFKRGS